jgi:hypothetical protein
MNPSIMRPASKASSPKERLSSGLDLLSQHVRSRYTGYIPSKMRKMVKGAGFASDVEESTYQIQENEEC